MKRDKKSGLVIDLFSLGVRDQNGQKSDPNKKTLEKMASLAAEDNKSLANEIMIKG